MATASTSPTNNNRRFEDLVKCGICLDLYDDPRLLPCSHTFCYQCIVKLCDEGIDQCPMRDNSILFRHTIDKLPINRVAKDLVESFIQSSSSSSSSNKCDYCKQILSEFFCETCSKYSCTLCLKLQHNLQEFSRHSIKILIPIHFNDYCSEHHEEKLKYWCNHCRQIVCSDSLLFQHPQHSFISLSKHKETIQIQLQCSIEQLNQIKEQMLKLNQNTIKTFTLHRQTHKKTRKSLEQTFEYLHNRLDKRKQELIDQMNRKDLEQQIIIEEQTNQIEEHCKSLCIRQLLTKQFVEYDHSLQLTQMNEDLINYNQFIEQQSKEYLQGYTFDLHHFNFEQTPFIQFEDFGQISTQTYLTDRNDIYPLLNISQLFGEEKVQSFDGNYAYGYRFQLIKPLKLNHLRVKINCHFIVLIIDHQDILIQKEIFNQNYSILQWVTIPIQCQIEQNYSIFLWTQNNEEHMPCIACKDSNHKLRSINEHVLVRSKRARINPSMNMEIQMKIDVLYDALFNQDQDKETIIPAIEMILHV